MEQSPEQLEALLADYVEGTLDEAGTRVVESHLAANESGRALIEALRADRGALQALPRLSAPTDLSEDLRAQLERDLLFNDKPIGSQQTRRFSPPVAAVAAILMVGLGLGAVAYVLLGNRPKPYVDIALQTPAASSTSTTMQPADAKRSDDDAGIAGVSKQEATASPSATDRNRASDATASLPTGAAAPATDIRATADAEQSDVAPSAAKMDALSLPQAAAKPGEVGANQGEAALASPIAPEPSLAVADAAPPADVAAALAGKPLDVGRRSVAIVVDQRDALDALATFSRAARTNGTTLEVSDRAAQLALPAAQSNAQSADLQRATVANAQLNVAVDNRPEIAAEVAVVARGLSLPAAIAIQDELKRIDPAIASAAYDLPRDFSDAGRLHQRMLEEVRAAAGAAATQPATSASGGVGENLGPATMPTTRTASAVIRNGDRLRVTLIDPDAFDLRTQHEVKVDPRGDIALPSLDGVQAAGETVDALRETIVDSYKRANLMRHPVVRVESIESGVVSNDPRDVSTLLDLYVIVRRPTTTPVEVPGDASTTQPATEPTTGPSH